jgi:hypothetical protein
MDQDVTLNWHSYDIDSKGIFYTDENAFQMIRRETDSYLK